MLLWRGRRRGCRRQRGDQRRGWRCRRGAAGGSAAGRLCSPAGRVRPAGCLRAVRAVMRCSNDGRMKPVIPCHWTGRRRTLVAAATGLTLAGCAARIPPGPTVTALPAPGESFASFQQKDASCQQYAGGQVGASPGRAGAHRALAGAVVGTGLGAAAGALFGSVSAMPAQAPRSALGRDCCLAHCSDRRPYGTATTSLIRSAWTRRASVLPGPRRVR